MFRNTFSLLVGLLLIFNIFGFSLSSKKPAPVREHEVLLKANVRYLNVLLQAYASKGCVLKEPPFPKVYYVDEDGLFDYCGPWALGCYHPMTHSIYVRQGDIHTLNHEFVHAIFRFNHLRRTCWEHMVILQMDFVLKPYIDQYVDNLEDPVDTP